MGVKTKVETFPYSFKSVGTYGNSIFSNSANQIGFEIINPANFYACTALFMRFLFLHDATKAGRNITKIAVQSDETTAPAFIRPLAVNITPAALLLDTSMDLTPLVNAAGRNVVMLTFDGAVSGTLRLFKLDMQYQVQGIR